MSYNTNTPNTSTGIDADYLCGRCSLSIPAFSATRPPNYNPENCSCAGSTALAYGTEQATYSYNHTTTSPFMQPRVPVSNASSSFSRNEPCPEEPEREVPVLMSMGGFLQVVPDPGLGEETHRRTSFRSEMSWQMRRYMKEQQEQYEAQFNIAVSDSFLRQEVSVQGLKKSGDGSGKTKSWESRISAESMESSLEVAETMPNDPVVGVGAWAENYEDEGVERGRNACGSGMGGYPLCMSGLTEIVLEIEGR